MPDDSIPRPKDGWDKLSILGQILLPVVLAVLTIVYGLYEHKQQSAEQQRAALLQREVNDNAMKLQRQNNETARVNAMAQFGPRLVRSADATQLHMAAAGLEALGYGTLATKLLSGLPSPDAVHVLEVLATSADSASTRGAAKEALNTIRLTARTALANAPGAPTVIVQVDSALRRVGAAEIREAQAVTNIVTGGYGSLQTAQAAASLHRVAGSEHSVYFRNGHWRTALRFPDRAASRSALPMVRERIRGSAYMVDWTRWCPDPVQRDGYTECRPAAPEQLVY